MKIHVIYKVCDQVVSAHGFPRPFGMTKKEVIKVCLASLKKAIEPLDCYTSIVGDNVSDEIWTLALENLKPKNSFNSREALNFRITMLKAADFAALSSGDEWVYFVEDDYLHDYNAFSARLSDFFNMVYGSHKFALPCFLHPSDYPDQYTRLLSRCYLFQGQTGYWREVCSSTETFLCPASFYKRKLDFFKHCYANDGVAGQGSDYRMSQIFRKEALCFSPLPGIATHMHEGLMSNYINWENVINRLLFEKI